MHGDIFTHVDERRFRTSLVPAYREHGGEVQLGPFADDDSRCREALCAERGTRVHGDERGLDDHEIQCGTGTDGKAVVATDDQGTA